VPRVHVEHGDRRDRRKQLVSRADCFLVEIGPEGWTPTQQPSELSLLQLATAKGATSTCAKKEEAET
jgi:hypothetical protein